MGSINRYTSMMQGASRLSRISERAAAFADQQKIDSFRLHEECCSIGRIRRDERRSVVQVQLTGTRHIEVTRGLVLTGMNRKRIQVQPDVRWSLDSRSSELVRDVRVEELCREFREQIHGVRL